jgi:SAM-dependent methyltransferase
MQIQAPGTLEHNLALLGPALRQTVALGAANSRPAVVAANGIGLASIQLEDGRLIPLSASDDPAAASDALVARLTSRGVPPQLVVIGIGLGYLLDALERADVPTKVLAVEPVAATVHAMLSRRDWTPWLASDRLHLVVGPEYAGAGDAWRLFGANAPTPPTIMAPFVERGFPAEAARAKALVAHILAGVRANNEARRRFAGRYLLNTLANVPVIAAEGDVAALNDAFAGVPAFVIGAGPSLDRNLPMLAAAKGRALLIAVDTAARPMLAAGVAPDVVVAVDPSELNGRHLRDLPNAAPIWLVAESSLDPEVLAPFAGHLFVFRVSNHEPWPYLDRVGAGRGKLRAWGSVLTSAFDLACAAGCDPVAFAGADLAYSRGLQYCRNTTYEPLWQAYNTDAARAERFADFLRANPTQSEPDVHGDAVTSTPLFVQFRNWIRDRVLHLSDRRVINATGAGILHGGSIEQIDDFQPAGNASVDVNARLRRAWFAGNASRADIRQRLAGGLRTIEAPRLAAWVEFGVTVSEEQVRERCAAAAEALERADAIASHVARERDRYDNAASTLAGARALVHPDYDFATAQAPSLVAHVLDRYDARVRRSVAQDETQATPPRHSLRVLDFGCGLGRTMVPFVAAGHAVDGVDVSARMLEHARQLPALAQSSFFHAGGIDCGDAPEGAYDLVCSIHAFHRIRPRSIRTALLRAMARALRPGGVVVLQLPFFPGLAVADVPAPHVAWSADRVDEPESHAGEVWPTADELALVLEDVSSVFCDVELQTVDFTASAPRFGLDRSTRLAHLIVTASTTPRLASRLYGVVR